MNNWVKTSQRLPEKSGRYLTIDDTNHMCVLAYSARHRLFGCIDEFSVMQAKELAIDVAYWRELPPPPNVGDVCNG